MNDRSSICLHCRVTSNECSIYKEIICFVVETANTFIDPLRNICAFKCIVCQSAVIMNKKLCDVTVNRGHSSIQCFKGRLLGCTHSKKTITLLSSTSKQTFIHTAKDFSYQYSLNEVKISDQSFSPTL